MTHYVCTGSCRGVTDVEGATCQATDCPLHGQPLKACVCENGEHEEVKGGA